LSMSILKNPPRFARDTRRTMHQRRAMTASESIESDNRHPGSERVEKVPEGDAVLVFTPCHSARTFHPIDQAVPGALLNAVCRECGRSWLVELVADDSAKCGLRPVWTEAKPDPEPDAETRPGEGR
jgi:hypothetical protein